MATWAIGDIHGCMEVLLELERRVREEDDAPLFVCVGDLIDRGPESREVVEHFREGVARGTHAAVMGNHEEKLLQVLHAERPDLLVGVDVPEWLETTGQFLDRRGRRLLIGSREDWYTWSRLMWASQGGAETIASYGGHPRLPDTWEIPVEHLAFLATLPLVWRDDTVVVTHALATRGHLRKAIRGGADRVTATQLLWSRNLPPDRPDPDRVHISGHTPRRQVTRHASKGCVQIDTGACMGQRLTAYCDTLDKVICVMSTVRWTPP